MKSISWPWLDLDRIFNSVLIVFIIIVHLLESSDLPARFELELGLVPLYKRFLHALLTLETHKRRYLK